MTDRINALTVVLEKDYRDDDVEFLKNAILAMRGVLSVDGNVVDIESFTASTRANSSARQKLLEMASTFNVC